MHLSHIPQYTIQNRNVHISVLKGVDVLPLWDLWEWSITSHNFKQTYRKTSSISHVKSQNLNVSCILWQMSSLNPLKPGVKLRMKM